MEIYTFWLWHEPRIRQPMAKVLPAIFPLALSGGKLSPLYPVAGPIPALDQPRDQAMNLAISRFTSRWTWVLAPKRASKNIWAENQTIWRWYQQAKKKPEASWGPGDSKSSNRSMQVASWLSMYLSGIIATGNFKRRGSFTIPSEEKQELILHTNDSSSRFMTAPSPWMVSPMIRLKSTGCWNMGCVFQAGNDCTCLQKRRRSPSSRLPSISESKAESACMTAMEWRISWGASTRTGTFRTFTESICRPRCKTYGCSSKP